MAIACLLRGHRLLEDDGHSDIKEYNEQLEALGNPNWFNVPWLYSECYMYRYGHMLVLLVRIV